MEEKCYLQYFFWYSQILRTTRWMKCFIRNSQKKHDRWESEMSVVDTEGVKRKLLNYVQQEILTEDGDFKLKLITLCTFMDTDGFLLVTTWINQRDDNQDF